MAEHEHKEGEGGGHGGGGHGGGGHGGGAHEEHEGAPEWLISFADNVMLIMGFFVILLAMNMTEKKQGGTGGDGEASGPNQNMIDFAIALREAFNNPFDLRSEDPKEEVFRKRIRERAALGGGRSNQPGDKGEEREAQGIRKDTFSELGGTVPFDDNSSSLGTRGRERADQIARRIQGLRFIIEVRGHASAAETMRQPERGFTLSFRRAQAVADALVAQGAEWGQLRLVAIGDGERIQQRASDRDLERTNQRVEVVVTGEPFGNLSAAGSPGGAAAEPEAKDSPAPAGGH